MESEPQKTGEGYQIQKSISVSDDRIVNIELDNNVKKEELKMLEATVVAA